MANIQDVATRAKVSIATVSRVLNESDHKVRPQTRARVLAAVRKLDYRPNALARGLLMKRTMTIGDVLYGVTMQEPGVSKKISVRFADLHKLNLDEEDQEQQSAAGA